MRSEIAATSFLFCLFCLVFSFAKVEASSNPCPPNKLREIFQDASLISPTTALLGGQGKFYQHLEHLPGQEGEKQLTTILLPQKVHQKPLALTVITAPFDQRGDKLPRHGPLSLALFRPGKLIAKQSISSLKCQTKDPQNLTLESINGPSSWQKVSLSFEKQNRPWLPASLSFTLPKSKRKYRVTYQSWMNVGPKQWFPAKFRVESFLTRNGNRAETLQLKWSRIKNTLSQELYQKMREALPEQDEKFTPYLFPEKSQKPLPGAFLKDIKEELQKPFPPFSKTPPPEIMFL